MCSIEFTVHIVTDTQPEKEDAARGHGKKPLLLCDFREAMECEAHCRLEPKAFFCLVSARLLLP